MTPGDKRTIRVVGAIDIDWNGVISPSGAPIGKLIGREATIVGPSQTYNDSIVVDVEGRVYDIHVEHLAA